MPSKLVKSCNDEDEGRERNNRERGIVPLVLGFTKKEMQYIDGKICFLENKTDYITKTS